ncbi:hypothetical protein B0H12DRAFT_1244375 [Mycena haematopus]|nr:hypothetical protein B0H12DRAFT_1244375 [Mycena haematopus]
MFYFGFEQAYQTGLKSMDDIFCLKSAKTVLHSMLELAPTGLMRYCPDDHFIFVAFASAFMLKLLRPEFSHLMPAHEGSEVYGLLGRVIQTLNSPEVAVDHRHIPKLYAHFLAELLSHHYRDSLAFECLYPPTIPAGSLSGSYGWSHASPMFTMSSLLGAGAACCSEHGTDECHRSENASIPIHAPVAICSGSVRHWNESHNSIYH